MRPPMQEQMHRYMMIAVFSSFLIFFVSNFYFGWNAWLPKSVPEFACDALVFITMGMAMAFSTAKQAAVRWRT